MRFSFVFLGILLMQMAMGQVKINGNVKDHKGKPISGVSVSLKDTYDGSTSDSLGHYSF